MGGGQGQGRSGLRSLDTTFCPAHNRVNGREDMGLKLTFSYTCPIILHKSSIYMLLHADLAADMQALLKVYSTALTLHYLLNICSKVSNIFLIFSKVLHNIT